MERVNVAREEERLYSASDAVDFCSVFIALLRHMKVREPRLPLVLRRGSVWHRIFRELQVRRPEMCPESVRSLEFELTSVGIRSSEIDSTIDLLAFLGVLSLSHDASSPLLNLESHYVKTLHESLSDDYEEFFDAVLEKYRIALSGGVCVSGQIRDAPT